MVEHTFLLGRAITEQVKTLPTDDAAAALTANGTDIANLFAGAYGSGFGSQFQPLWAARSAAFEAYATAKAAGSDTTAAVAQIASSASALATLIHTTNKYLEIHTVTNPPTGIGDEFTTLDGVVQTYVDAAATNDTTQYTKLVAAAEAIPHTAEMLAAATAKLYPDTYTGTPTGTAANLRSSLTELGVEQVELAALATGPVAGGKDSGAQTAALAANTGELHNAFAATYGDATAQQFDGLWGDQVQGLMAYAKARATGDSPGAQAATAQLEIFAGSFGQFVSRVTAGGVDAATATTAITTQLHAVENAIDGAASNASDEASRIRAAAGAAPAWMASLSEAMSVQFPTRYLP
jgi:hypothetical protein